MMEIKVDNQVAAPAETRNTQLAPSDKTSLTKSADGRVATVATRRGEKPCPIKKKMNPLDSDRPSHGRRLRSLTLVGASDESQVFFVQEVLKSWFSAAV